MRTIVFWLFYIFKKKMDHSLLNVNVVEDWQRTKYGSVHALSSGIVAKVDNLSIVPFWSASLRIKLFARSLQMWCAYKLNKRLK
jgi:hypothetical protein